ncbi:hypothetical protein P167DRAFT_563994 [Morchella conica CCBAS932]|uniref:Uncharacterized protein n=1 Tax=Morchella conica CCBAS932 TaxID=1392247 RepID=A0A3N4KUG0_9PEZI|nr:hypothetical protein P167DRAFT_563994 [Morchella conica CCBAS932]
MLAGCGDDYMYFAMPRKECRGLKRIMTEDQSAEPGAGTCRKIKSKFPDGLAGREMIHHHHHRQRKGRLDTYNIPPQFLYGGGSSSSSSTRSPDGVLASNYSLKSELEKIRLEDHYFLRPSSTAAADADATLEPDEYPDPENINLSSLMSRMRQIRSSGQIQYRIPKKRRRADEPKPRAEGELEDDELETVTIQRQKRVKKNPRGPRGEKEKERGKEKERERERERRRVREWRKRERGGLLRPACHPPMVLETILECHPPMALDDEQFDAMEAEMEAEGSEMKLVVE